MHAAHGHFQLQAEPPNPGTSQREDREAVEPVEPSKDVGPERRVYIGFRV